MPLRTCSTCARAFKPRNPDVYQCSTHEPRGRVSRSPTTRAQDAEYERERAAALAGNPLCYWGCGRLASTADHLVAVSAHTPEEWAKRGGPHKGNIVAACAPCNYSRQANPDWIPPHDQRPRVI